MNICIVTAIYGRHDLTKIILDYYSRLEFDDVNIHLVAVGSEGEYSRDIAINSGWNYYEYENQPLSQKFNALFEATKFYDPDLVILVGSDDLVSHEIIRWYIRNIRRDHKNLVGLKDLYFYSIKEDSTVYFPGYNALGSKHSPRSIGAGRCFSRHILEVMDFKPWQKERVNRGLDSSSTNQMKRRGIGEDIITMEQIGGCAVDVKHPLVTLTKWERVFSEERKVDNSLIEKHFSTILATCKGLRNIRTFEDDKTYDVQVTKQGHPLYGQIRHVNGKTAKDWAIKRIIETP